MEGLSTNDLLGAAAEEVLEQLERIPLVRERVFRYIPRQAQKRLASRIAHAVLAKLFGRASLALSLVERDSAVEALPDRGSRYPSRMQYVRHCHICKADRPVHYSNLALRCMKCGTPTSPMQGDDDERPAEPVRRAI